VLISQVAELVDVKIMSGQRAIGVEPRKLRIQVRVLSWLLKLRNMILVKENKGFTVYFDCNSQTYTVTKDGKFLIGDKHKFIQVKSYLD
jgi:hypothetical protein